jgi:cellulose synthase/poly-beta-1,6-N-acetylglucosamine synthase-like glycosyltransferase
MEHEADTIPEGIPAVPAYDFQRTRPSSSRPLWKGERPIGDETSQWLALVSEEHLDKLADTTELRVVQHPHRRKNRRTQAMYLIIVLAWVLLCIPMAVAAAPVINSGLRRDGWLGALAIITTVFIAYFWLNGVKDVVYPLAYRLTSWRREVVPARTSTDRPDVCLVYVTCNDFSESSLAASLEQDYDNYWTVILDDSSKAEYRARVDAFAQLHGIPVVRRPDRPEGFKAGNLNWFLRSADARDIDYFGIVDSDEVLPSYFISRTLDYFADPEVGIVQANHIATRNRTTFMKRFAPGVDSHWPVYQKVKHHAGFLSLLGHGAMVSMDAYRAAGGFPKVVSEDIGFAIDARRAGYRVAFAEDVICEEEFPPDYEAFRTRHGKWTMGNMEFIRTYSGRIFFDRALKWYERLDIVLFTYSLPLTGVFSIYVILNAVVFPELHFSNHFPLWMLVPTVTFLLAPMFNDLLTFRHRPKWKLLSYLLGSVGLFGSMYFISLAMSLRTMFGGSKFPVTPKHAGSSTLRSAIVQNRLALIGSAVLAGAVQYASGSILPVVLILIPALSSVWLSVMNRKDHPDMFDGRHFLEEDA